MTDRTKVRGADTLRRTLGRAADNLADLTGTNTKVAQSLAADAASRAPRKSGALAASLRGTGDPDTADIGSALVYGPPIHWGWAARGIDPNPFITDTIADRTEKVASTYMAAVTKEVRRIKGA